MKIITWNINGYRSAEKTKSVEELIAKQNPDILCLQELKMNAEFDREYGYHCYYNFAEKKGYSGVAILTKEEPISVIKNIGLERFDSEGRFLVAEYSNFVIINIYIPHGGRQKENHPYKFAAIDKLLEYIKGIKKDVVICTDFNIAHTELDVKNYKHNYNNNMFSYEERAKIDELLQLDFVDSFRELVKDGDIYSMWPNGFNARERNMGWRIDYIFITSTLAKQLASVSYLKGQYGSDHCPYVIEIKM